MEARKAGKGVDSSLPDEATRKRFREELDRNFSVIAPAGVGKTTAIVERVVKIALTEDRGWGAGMKRMVVVTYTRKAAREMQIRSRNELLRRPARPESLARLTQAFFGTIHSFCLELLRAEGHLMGLPSSIDIVGSDEALWLQFLRENDRILDFLDESKYGDFQRHSQTGRVMELSRSWRGSAGSAKRLGPLVKPDFAPLFDFTPNRRNRKGVEEGKEILHRWVRLFEEGRAYLPLPQFKKGGKEFQALWSTAFLPLRRWLEGVGFEVVQRLAGDFREFRVGKGLLTYDDLVYFASALLAHPIAGPRIRSREHSVILDEAQDTDREQFRVLLGLAQSAQAGGDWLAGEGPPPEPGRFCMVGDPQQSIFSSRADLPTYLKIHRRLVDEEVADGLNFSVTFRCDREIVTQVNRCFPTILSDSEGQVRFEPLTSRPGAGPGQVVRCELTPVEDFQPDGGIEESSMAEARSLAAWLERIGTDGLGVKDWAKVAVLCPRKRWLSSLSFAFEEVRLKPVLQSKEEIWGDNPAFAWLCGLVVVMVEPENAFEIVGVLREIFGISDHDLAMFVKERSESESRCHPVQIRGRIRGDGKVVEALNLLVETRIDVVSLPLYEFLTTLVERTNLRERVEELPGYPKDSLSAILDALLEEGAEWEEQGHSLKELAGILRNRFREEADGEEGGPDQISLTTCHKAKGLEWDVVILPFLFRKIGFFSDSYPRLVRVSGKGNPRLLLTREEDSMSMEQHLERDRRQECERLLYVAATRAKRSLVLIDSTSFYQETSTGRGFSFAELLRIHPGEANYQVWNGLPRDLEVQDYNPKTNGTGPVTEGIVERFDPSLINEAASVAGRFTRRVIPSSLALEGGATLDREESDLAVLPIFPEQMVDRRPDGAEYGNWWHQTMESNPWIDCAEMWDRHFEDKLARCPDENRGRAELELFKSSPLAQILVSPEYRIRTEVPVLWGKNQGTAYEGYIDLAAWHSEKRKWLVVDWKTDRVTADSVSELKKTYGSQLNAYAESVAGIFPDTKVEAMLYSTILGKSLLLGS